MTHCISYCLVGAALLGSMLVTMLASKKSKNFKHFMSVLNDDQQQVYKSVINERMNIYSRFSYRCYISNITYI